MNFTVSEVKRICERLNIKPSKSMGQNFLIDKNILEKIIQAGEIKKDDLILEIGPGLGILTVELVKHASRVVAVEKDRRLAEYLTLNKKQLAVNNNLEIVNEDALKFDPLLISPLSRGREEKIVKQNYKIIANLPYSISTQVLWKFLHTDPLCISPLSRGRIARPDLMVLMLQKEVGERICAVAGKMNVLAVLCQFYAECEIVSLVGQSCFWPAPEVESVIVKLKVKKTPPPLPLAEHETRLNLPLRQLSTYKGGDGNKEFMRIVKIGFSAKRKMLKNNLANGLQIEMEKVVKILQKIGLDEKIRAQNLTVKNWVDLTREVIF